MCVCLLFPVSVFLSEHVCALRELHCLPVCTVQAFMSAAEEVVKKPEPKARKGAGVVVDAGGGKKKGCCAIM
jgi:hypothetical protein